jgi:hypothetical protein
LPLGTEESSLPNTQARLLGKFDITIKLNREPCDAGPQNAFDWLDRHFMYLAWKPKQFQITIEEGVFRLPCKAGKEIEDLRGPSAADELRSGYYEYHGWARWFKREEEDPSQRQLYGYRVVFDKSPFPPPEEYARPYHPQVTNNYPETKVEFVAYKLLDSGEEPPAMNEAWQREMVRVWEAQPLSKPIFQQEMWRKEYQRRSDSRERRRKEAAERKARVKESKGSAATEEVREEIKSEPAIEGRGQKEE